MFLSWFSTGDLQFLQRALRLLLSSEHCVANLRLHPEQVVMVTPRFLGGMRKDGKWREITQDIVFYGQFKSHDSSSITQWVLATPTLIFETIHVYYFAFATTDGKLEP